MSDLQHRIWSVRSIASALGGDVAGRNTVLAPGPGHSRKDRSLQIKLDPGAPDGFFVHSYCGDDWRDCRKYVCAKLGLPDWRPGDGQHRTIPQAQVVEWDNDSEADEGPHHWTEPELANICRAFKVWEDGQDPRGTLAEVYLQQHRKLDLPEQLCGTVLRFHPRCPWRDENTGKTIAVPALIAPFRSIDNDMITAIQRVRLNEDGSKYERRMLGIVKRSAIKLDTVGEQLCVGEGLETCLAGRQLKYTPAWALGSVGAISLFPLINGVTQITIFGETGKASAHAVKLVAARWRGASRRVRVAMPSVGSDLNDVLIAIHRVWK